MKRCVIIAVVAMVILASCKKEKNNPSLSGKVIDVEQGTAIAGIEVKLFKQVVSGGVASTASTLVGSRVTSASGGFSFEVERESVQVFELKMSSESYRAAEFTVNPDDVFNQESHSETFSLQPRTWVGTHIVNTGATAPSDEVRFRFLNADFICICCNEDLQTFMGADVDTTVYCELPESLDLQYAYDIYQGGIEIGSDAGFVNAAPLDTTLIEVIF